MIDSQDSWWHPLYSSNSGNGTFYFPVETGTNVCPHQISTVPPKSSWVNKWLDRGLLAGARGEGLLTGRRVNLIPLHHWDAHPSTRLANDNLGKLTPELPHNSQAVPQKSPPETTGRCYIIDRKGLWVLAPSELPASLVSLSSLKKGILQFWENGFTTNHSLGGNMAHCLSVDCS